MLASRISDFLNTALLYARYYGTDEEQEKLRASSFEQYGGTALLEAPIWTFPSTSLHRRHRLGVTTLEHGIAHARHQ